MRRRITIRTVLLLCCLCAMVATLGMVQAGIINVARLNVMHPSGGANCSVISGTTDPEGAVVGKPCDVYLNDNGTIWQKDDASGTDNSGWSQVGAANIQTLLDTISTTQGVILYYNGTDWVALATGTSGQYLKTQGAAANPIWDDTPASPTLKFGFAFDGGGSDVPTGSSASNGPGVVRMSHAGTIDKVTLMADAACTTTIDLWIGSTYLPTVSNTITASDKPALSSATNSTKTSFTGWTLGFSDGDYALANVDSNTGCGWIVVLVEYSPG